MVDADGMGSGSVGARRGLSGVRALNTGAGCCVNRLSGVLGRLNEGLETARCEGLLSMGEGAYVGMGGIEVAFVRVLG